MLICQTCQRNPHSCDYPCSTYFGEKQPINNKTCFVTILAEYYFDHLPEEKQTDENLDLLWQAGVYLERHFRTCSGTKI